MVMNYNVEKELEVAWAAGLFEGEGSVGCYTSGGRMRPKAVVTSTDRDVLERFQRAVGFGSIPPKPQPGVNKPVYRWQCSGWTAVRTLGFLFDGFLGERRSAQLDGALAEDQMRDGGGQVQTHCKRGHLLPPPIVRADRGTVRHECLKCRRITRRARRGVS